MSYILHEHLKPYFDACWSTFSIYFNFNFRIPLFCQCILLINKLWHSRNQYDINICLYSDVCFRSGQFHIVYRDHSWELQTWFTDFTTVRNTVILFFTLFLWGFFKSKWEVIWRNINITSTAHVTFSISSVSHRGEKYINKQYFLRNTKLLNLFSVFVPACTLNIFCVKIMESKASIN